MPDLEAHIWVDDPGPEFNAVMVTVAIPGVESQIYELDRNMWDSIEPSVLDGSFLLRFLTPAPEADITAQAATGRVQSVEDQI